MVGYLHIGVHLIFTLKNIFCFLNFYENNNLVFEGHLRLS